MDPTVGTLELAIVWPDGREERLPHALLLETYSSLPDNPPELRARVAALTQKQEPPTAEELLSLETQLLKIDHDGTENLGLLNPIALRVDGFLLGPNGLPDAWPGVRAPYVLALALRRLRLLRLALGTRIESVDVQKVKG